MTTRLKLKARKRPRRLVPLFASGVFFGLTLIFYNRFMDFVEARPGVRMADPILALLPKDNAAYLIFALIYGGIILGIWEHGRDLRAAAQVMRAYGLLILLRIAAMAVTPLDPPADLIVLRDPIVEFFGNSRVLTRDLFFSGHTATLTLLFLLSRERSHRVVLGLSTALVAFALLVQRAHYTIDVVAAPFFALGAVTLEARLFRGLRSG